MPTSAWWPMWQICRRWRARDRGGDWLRSPASGGAEVPVPISYPDNVCRGRRSSGQAPSLRQRRTYGASPWPWGGYSLGRPPRRGRMLSEVGIWATVTLTVWFLPPRRILTG